MAGTIVGYLKGKMGLRGKTKPGEMIARMNALKTSRATPVKSPTKNGKK